MTRIGVWNYAVYARMFAVLKKTKRAMRKIKVTDDSINSYGTRVLTSGISLERFTPNPVGLYNHNRSWEGKVTDQLPICKWVELETGKDYMIAMPEFDMEDDFAAKVARKYEKGILNAASIGIIIIETSEDSKYMLPGQRYPTITKCILREISICDIPSNANSVCLYDTEGNHIGDTEEELTLALSASKGGSEEITKIFDFDKNTNEMELKFAALKLGLKETATEAEVLAKMSDIQAQNIELSQKVEAYEAASKLAKTKQIEVTLNEAVTAKKIKEADKASWKQILEANLEAGKAALDAIAPTMSLHDFSNKGGESSDDEDDVMKYQGKTFSELSKSKPKVLENLKSENFSMFQQLYESEYKVPYKK